MNRRRLLQNAAALLLAPSAAKLAPPALAAPALEPTIRESVLTATSDFQMFGEMGLVASGGICSPASPYYALADLSGPVRPIRDALPRLASQRGGVRYETPEALS